jgi:hypothetical protein
MHEGTFERTSGESPLAGPGQVEVTPSGLQVRGQVRRAGVILALSVIAFVLGVLVTLGIATLAVQVLHLALTPKLGAVLALGGGLGTGAAASEILGRVLPRRPFDHVIPFAHLALRDAPEGTLGLASSDPRCRGAIDFRSATARDLGAALEQHGVRHRDRAVGRHSG